MQTRRFWFCVSLALLSCSAVAAAADDSSAAGAPNPPDTSSDLARTLGITFIPSSRSAIILERDGKKYLIDVAARSVREATPNVLSSAGLVQMTPDKLGKCEAVFARY